MICGVPEYLLYESLLYASRTSRHTGEQQDDAVQSAPRQDSVDSPGDPLGLLRKRGRQTDSPEILHSTRQVKLSKRGSSAGTTAPLAAPSSYAAITSSSKVSRFNASKLAGDFDNSAG